MMMMMIKHNNTQKNQNKKIQQVALVVGSFKLFNCAGMGDIKISIHRPISTSV